MIRNTATATFIVGLAVGLVSNNYLKGDLTSLTTVIPSPAPDGLYKVVRVVDGDTVVLLINGKNEKVRLIGVDTPETVAPGKPVGFYGHEASLFTSNLLRGEMVFIEYDKQEAGVEDRFGRELAYLYRAPDSLFVNIELLRQGYAKAYRKKSHRYSKLFEQVESEARALHKGLWDEKER